MWKNNYVFDVFFQSHLTDDNNFLKDELEKVEEENKDMREKVHLSHEIYEIVLWESLGIVYNLMVRPCFRLNTSYLSGLNHGLLSIF